MSDKTPTVEEFETMFSPFYAKMQNLIPRHREIFENFKLRVNKLITQGYIHELQKETKDKMEKIRELEAYKQELVNLRSKIPKANQNILDSRFEQHHTSINELLQAYSEHMHIVNDILISKKIKEERVETTSVSSLQRFPKTIAEFDRYKDEFLKYEALHDYVDDDFLLEVMKELVSWSKKDDVEDGMEQSNQDGSSSIAGNTENVATELKSENSTRLVPHVNDEI